MNNKSLKLFSLTLTTAALLSMGVVSQVQADTTTMSNREATKITMSAKDQAFFNKAAMSGMTEIAAGKMAVTQGTTKQVQMFGQQMVDDHTKAANELMTLASSKNVTLPTELDADHQAMLTQLKGKTGADFDTAFAAAMKSGHKMAIANFTAATQSKDAEVAEYATKTLPVLKEHQGHIAMMSKSGDKMSSQ